MEDCTNGFQNGFREKEGLRRGSSRERVSQKLNVRKIRKRATSVFRQLRAVGVGPAGVIAQFKRIARTLAESKQLLLVSR